MASLIGVTAPHLRDSRGVDANKGPSDPNDPRDPNRQGNLTQTCGGGAAGPRFKKGKRPTPLQVATDGAGTSAQQAPAQPSNPRRPQLSFLDVANLPAANNAPQSLSLGPPPPAAAADMPEGGSEINAYGQLDVFTPQAAATGMLPALVNHLPPGIVYAPNFGFIAIPQGESAVAHSEGPTDGTMDTENSETGEVSSSKYTGPMLNIYKT